MFNFFNMWLSFASYWQQMALGYTLHPIHRTTLTLVASNGHLLDRPIAVTREFD
jgi:hypothetical protein